MPATTRSSSRLLALGLAGTVGLLVLASRSAGPVRAESAPPTATPAAAKGLTTPAPRQPSTQADMTGPVLALYALTRPGSLPLAGGVPAVLSHLRRVDQLRAYLRAEQRPAARKDDSASALPPGQPAIRPTALASSTRIATQDRPRKRRQRKRASRPRLRPTHQATPTSAFAELRGRLAWPLPATPWQTRAALRGAQRLPPQTGLKLLARAGTAVRAAAAGRVIYTGQHHDGRFVVALDHGARYRTVYSGLAESGVTRGDHVSARAYLGRLPEENADAVLTFAVRRGSRPLHTVTWLSPPPTTMEPNSGLEQSGERFTSR